MIVYTVYDRISFIHTIIYIVYDINNIVSNRFQPVTEDSVGAAGPRPPARAPGSERASATRL